MNKNSGPWKWSLTIFASREPVSLLIATIHNVLLSVNNNTVVDVLINGNTRLASDLVCQLDGSLGEDRRLRVWVIEFGDKANAWNSYFHRIWDGQSIAFFMDGYVGLRSGSIELLGSALERESQSVGGCGVPSGSNSSDKLAEKMLAEGGFHGNFCAIKGSVIETIKRRGIRIPLGMYRTDSLVGAWLAFGLDPSTNNWDIGRLLVVSEVTWDTPVKKWWRYSDIKSAISRKVRQSRGDLENTAVRYFLGKKKMLPEALPSDVWRLVSSWVAACPEEWNKIKKLRLLSRYSFDSMSKFKGLDGAKELPRRLWPRESDRG